MKNFFSRPHYESETTKFLNNLHKVNKDLAQKQREGRELLWDKGNSIEAQKMHKQNLKHPAYKYYQY